MGTVVRCPACTLTASEMNPPTAPAGFAPTPWTLVLRARGESPEARVALSELCATYYQPVFRFLRREGRDEDAARELAQEFFARVLQHGDLGAADPSRGRFRSYLLGAVKHFLADHRKQPGRQKRGGGRRPRPWTRRSPTKAPRWTFPMPRPKCRTRGSTANGRWP